MKFIVKFEKIKKLFFGQFAELYLIVIVSMKCESFVNEGISNVSVYVETRKK